MNTNPLHEGAIIIHGTGIGTVTGAMIGNRASELAMINGREAHEASQTDWDDATRELTGGGEFDSRQTFLDSVPESERWNPIPGSPGHEALVAFDDNEDVDGRSVGARLAEEGVEEAAHDQMLEAATTTLLEND